MDSDDAVDLDALDEIMSGPGPYPWTVARDVRLLIREVRERRIPRTYCRGNVHVMQSIYSYDCQCRRTAWRR